MDKEEKFLPFPLNVKNPAENCENPGLLFDKYIRWEKEALELEEDKRGAFKKVIKGEEKCNEILKKYEERWKYVLKTYQEKGYKVKAFKAKTKERVVVGLGSAHVLESSLTLHPIYGFPVIPGSSLKGIVNDCIGDKEEKEKICGNEKRRGGVIFFDAFPLDFKLEEDIINVHYPEYYRSEGKEAPAEWSSPDLIYFLAVPKGINFLFSLASKDQGILEEAWEKLEEGIKERGIGAKTLVGYGRFSNFEETPLDFSPKDSELSDPSSDTKGSIIRSVTLKLKAENEALISLTQGYQIYSFILSILGKKNPELGFQIHSENSAKPLTTSPLSGKFQKVGKGKLKPIKGEEYQFRVTTLKEEVFSELLWSLKESEIINLGSVTFTLEKVEEISESFEQIWEKAKPEGEITLEFLSPTCFKSKGKNVLFPLPELAFKSLLSKWNSFSPIKFALPLENSLEEILIPSKHKIESRTLDFGNHKEVGFEGICTYLIKERASLELQKQINALADFAFFAGVGAKTTMGMGQTRRIG